VFNSAIRGSFPHAKLWLQMAGMVDQNDEATANNVILIKFGD
jgi:hypothetical protein